jgi:Polyketide cyclase / dehydrase and lipid transport
MARHIPVVVRGAVSAPIELVFDTIVPIELPRIFHGAGPLPAVVDTYEQSGAWDHVGASRVVQLSDGSQARERITAYQRPHHFAYRVGPFSSGPLRHLITDVEGAWRFYADGANTTQIEWTYAFQAARLTAIIVRLVLAPAWRFYAKRVLALAIAEVKTSQAERLRAAEAH